MAIERNPAKEATLAGMRVLKRETAALSTVECDQGLPLDLRTALGLATADWD